MSDFVDKFMSDLGNLRVIQLICPARPSELSGQIGFCVPVGDFYLACCFKFNPAGECRNRTETGPLAYLIIIIGRHKRGTSRDGHVDLSLVRISLDDFIDLINGIVRQTNQAAILGEPYERIISLANRDIGRANCLGTGILTGGSQDFILLVYLSLKFSFYRSHGDWTAFPIKFLWDFTLFPALTQKVKSDHNPNEPNRASSRARTKLNRPT